MASGHPIAVGGGSPVPIEAAEERQQYSCVACRQPMAVASEPDPHFQHVDDQQAESCDADLALHRVAIYYIKRGIESGVYEANWICPQVGRPWASGWECEPVAVDLGADCVEVEPRVRVVPSAGSDLVARYSSRDSVIIDVVSRLPAAPVTEREYRETGHLVFLVKTSWDDVGMLQKGIESAEVLNGLCWKCLVWEKWQRAWLRGEDWAMAWVKGG